MEQETELKFIGPQDALAKVRRSSAFRRLSHNRKPQTRVFHAVYFDTDELALRNAGYVLRVRKEGDAFVQTLKSVSAADIATRLELKAKVNAMAPDISAIADDDVRRRVAKAVGKDEARPLFYVEMRRTTMLLKPRRGCEIEAAFDVGVVRAIAEKKAAPSMPLSELELELLKGTANDLAACAKELTQGLPLTLSLESKAARGYALTSGMVDAAGEAQPIALPADATAGTAFSLILAHCLEHLLGNWRAVMVARDPEGIHQMRVALRRLRSALSLFDGPIRASARALEEEVRWLSGVMGEARDLDVFQDEVLRPAADAHGDDARMGDLAAVVRSRRRIAWANAVDALESERFRRLALEIASVTLTKPWLDTPPSAVEAMRDLPAFAAERLERRYERAVKLGRRAGELDAAERHVLRIRLKKLRYACDFFQFVFAKRGVKKFLKRLGALQDVLGELNDASVARALVREILVEQRDGEGVGSVGYAAGVVVGWHVGHARERQSRLQRRWRKFVKAKRPWAVGAPFA